MSESEDSTCIPEPEKTFQRWRVQLVYDGTDFWGWQRMSDEPEELLGNAGQAKRKTKDMNDGRRTVQGQLDAALTAVFRTGNIQCVGSSRTDRGVHARGQWAHFDVCLPSAEEKSSTASQKTPSKSKKKERTHDNSAAANAALFDQVEALTRLRRALPRGIQAARLEMLDKHDGKKVHGSKDHPLFHARMNGVCKLYSYRLIFSNITDPFRERYVWYCGSNVDVALLKRAAAELFDDKDLDYSVAFTSKDQREGVEEHYHGDGNKRVRVRVKEEQPGEVVILLSSKRFLYKMCRRIVGCLVDLAKQRLRFPSPEEGGAASFAAREVTTAPPEGLCLECVQFSDEWQVDRIEAT
eukprot:TRINITY_DN74837_c0_g1_i1.p1 TRINITY_DN74837_c0_g1~~TRINITY_DN74837_c0_g1_i1.p1  ORF type:complete len:353 (-),score=44.39 TRINITY_DN74837_c0_g1_i1:73-1131(-)